MIKKLNGKDLLLSFLYSPGIEDKVNEPIVGRTKLTKMMFLFEKEINNKFFKDKEIELPNFEPYYFGPFSKDLFDDLSFFLSIEMIETEETNIYISVVNKYESELIVDEDIIEYKNDEWSCDSIDNNNEEKYELKYKLSATGIKYVEDNIWNQYTENQKQNLKIFKSKINSISLDSLLNYVYNKYPDMAKKSIIIDKYLDTKKES